jgi:hypothetical protein
MFKEYFENLGNELIKACRPTKAVAAKSAGKAAVKGAEKGTRKPAPKGAPAEPGYDRARVRDLLSSLVPAHLKLDSVRITDAGGFIPDNVDFTVYREAFRNMDTMMSAIPSDLVHGALFLNTGITVASLTETLTRVANLKKIDRFGEQHDSSQFIPAFVISMDMSMTYQDLKNIILDFYVSRSLDNYFEFDIMAIVNRGIVVKDWREKRSFKILDTGEDTMKWFFILINEYLDVEKEGALDLRKYVKDAVQYREY